ncbi:helix-turn-helix transcriptional regulator [Pseudoalteromonas fuliginea]|uniref:helix-turn-helix domain-containing protein n=1 Tax=Pseudoalteromonas TaxID=53246 RepID=UPI00316F33D5
MKVDVFCELLKNFLEHSGVSQNMLAKQSGVSQSQISDWSKGKLTRFGRNPKKVMGVIENYRKSQREVISEGVFEAVIDFCQGSVEKEKKLIQLLELLK